MLNFGGVLKNEKYSHCTRVIMLPTQTIDWYKFIREIPQNYHQCVLFDSPEMGSL